LFNLLLLLHVMHLVLGHTKGIRLSHQSAMNLKKL